MARPYKCITRGLKGFPFSVKVTKLWREVFSRLCHLRILPAFILPKSNSYLFQVFLLAFLMTEHPLESKTPQKTRNLGSETEMWIVKRLHSDWIEFQP